MLLRASHSVPASTTRTSPKKGVSSSSLQLARKPWSLTSHAVRQYRAICLGLLKSDQWSVWTFLCFTLAPSLSMPTLLAVYRKPSTKVEDVLLALQQLLVEPNPDDPLIPAIAEQYRTDKAGFKNEAQLQVKKVCLRGLPQ